jgi:hypothetical protein
MEGHHFHKKTATNPKRHQKELPPGTQKRRKTEKSRADDPLKTHAKKKSKTKGENKPVLAKEREARLKEKGCRAMVSRLCWILVWSSAAPAALPRPRFRVRKHLEKHTQITKKTCKTYKAELRAPPCGPVSQKNTRETPKTAQTSQRHPKE